MVTPLEALNNFISKDEYDDLGKYHEPDPNHMTPGYGTPNKKSAFPKETGDFKHNYTSFETQPHSVTFNYQGGVKAVHQNHYSQADHFKQQSYHVQQAKTAKAAGQDATQMGHTNAAAAHGYQARNMVQPGHDTLTFSRPESHHGGKYGDGAHLPWVGKANEDSYRDKLLKNPDIIPPKGQRKEDVVDALIKQKIRQKDNNKRANNLLNAEIADPGGGSKAGGDSAMYRLSEFVQKPIEAAEDDSPPIWGKPKDSHIKKANRLIELVDIDPDEVKVDDPPKHKSKKHLAELKFIKQFKDKLDDESFIDEVSLQDDDLEEPFKRYLRDKELELSSDEKDNLEQIHRDTSTLVHKFKIFYNRQRPHQADDDIDEIENTAGKSPSYPSGHSANAYMMGEYLANKFPEHADELRNIGKRIGLNRVIVGLHYPSDHIAGVELGQQVVRGIPGITDVKKSDAFMDELFKYMEHRADLFKDMTQIGTQDILDGVRIDKEKNPRIPRKKGQPAKSKKHSDLYTDEDPKGTIQGLGFKDDATAKASVKKIRNSGRAHAHKIQAAVAMEQRAKAAGKSSEAGIYRKYIDSMKKKTQAMEKHTEEEHTQEHNASDNYYPKVSVDKSKKSLLDQLNQIESKIETGDYGIEKSEDIFLEKAKKKFMFEFKDDKDKVTKYDLTKPLSSRQFTTLSKIRDADGNSGIMKYLQEGLANHIVARRGNATEDEIKGVQDFYKDTQQYVLGEDNIADAFQNYQTNFELHLTDYVKKEEKTKKELEDEQEEARKKLEEEKRKKKKKEDEKLNKKKKQIKQEIEDETEDIKDDDPPNNGGGGGSKQKYTTAHQNRINAIQQARQELNTHLDSFNKVKATAPDPTFLKMGHMEKFNNARDKYDKAVAKEQTYRNSQENRGRPRPNPAEDEQYKDLFSDVTEPEYTDADNEYIKEKNKIINIGREKGLIDWYYEQNHSSEFDEHHGNREGSEAELLNQPLSKLRQALKKLAETKPDDSGGSDGSDDGGGAAPKVSNEELRAQERAVVQRGEEISNKYFDRDESGNFIIKPDLDKHDILNGMRETSRLMNEDWKGEDNKFNREEDGSVTDSDDTKARYENRMKVLRNPAFNRLVALGAALRTQGLMQQHGMTEEQSQKSIDAIDAEYDALGEDFMNPNTENGKKHLEQVYSKEDFEASNKAHEDYKKVATGRFRQRGKLLDRLRGKKPDPEDVTHTSPLASNTEHTDEEAREWQKPMSAADVAAAQAEINNNDKLSDAQKEKERIRQGLPPEGSPVPIFQGEEEGETVQGVWHRETHRWAKPETLISGAGSTGHFDSMPDNSFMHLTDKEFNDLQGIKGTNPDQFSALANTSKNGVIAHKDKDGNMNFHAGKAGEEDMYANKTIAPVGHGTSSENHAKRQADIDNVTETVKRDRQNTKFGGKKLYRIDTSGRIKHIGNAEFKPRKLMTNIGQSSTIGRKVSSALKRYGDAYMRSVRNYDAENFIREAKAWRKQNKRKPNININSDTHRARFSKFTPDQLLEISQHANLFRSKD